MGQRMLEVGRLSCWKDKAIHTMPPDKPDAIDLERCAKCSDCEEIIGHSAVICSKFVNRYGQSSEVTIPRNNEHVQCRTCDNLGIIILPISGTVKAIFKGAGEAKVDHFNVPYCLATESLVDVSVVRRCKCYQEGKYNDPPPTDIVEAETNGANQSRGP